MQVRAGNRQDEPLVRAIVTQYLEEQGRALDLEDKDRDLRNLEANYFWHDGLFIVAERDGQLIGMLAGRKNSKSDEILDLKRLVVTTGARRRGVAKALVKTMLFFAQNMEYKKVEFKDSESVEDQQRDAALARLGFEKSNQESQSWAMKVPAKSSLNFSPGYR